MMIDNDKIYIIEEIKLEKSFTQAFFFTDSILIPNLEL